MAPEFIPIEQDIENSLDAREKLMIAIDDLNKERQDAESKCAISFATDLRTAKASIADLAVAKLNEWQAKDKRIGERIDALEDMGQKIADQIEGFKGNYKDNFVAVLERRIEKLRIQRTEQKSGTETLNKRITELEHELKKLSGGKSPEYATQTQQAQGPPAS
jgi:hypothetical protein